MKFKSKLKRLAMSLAPSLTLELLSNRSQNLIMRLERESGHLDISKQFCAINGAAVLDGPFKGMRYPEFTISSRNLVHKLTASYEDELTPWIEGVTEKTYTEIVNIGSADGYYSVGLAIRCPSTLIISFDTDRWARKATRLLAEENNISNVEILSMCTPNWLDKNLKENTLLLVDCEGCEAQLLDTNIAASLLSCDLIVELHDKQAPGIGDLLKKRFSETHDINIVTAKTKNPDDYPLLSTIQKNQRASIISEGRHGPQEWFYLTRKNL